MNCSGADGTCERPAVKRGLCWGHYERTKPRWRKPPPISAPVKEYRHHTTKIELGRKKPGPKTGQHLESLYAAALELQGELDTKTNEEFQLSRERFRDKLRRYLWAYVPVLLKRAPFSPPTRAEVDRFLEKYGDKSSHSPQGRSTQRNPRSRK